MNKHTSTTAIAANIAALLAAIGVNISEPMWQVGIEIIAGLVAIAGIAWGVAHRKET